VLPTWLLDMWPARFGPFTLHRNGESVLARDGNVRPQTSAARFKLPMCPSCNGELDRRFEKPAKQLIRRIFNSDGVLDPPEAEIVGLWFVKTWLLLAHPEVRVSDPGFDPKPWVPPEQHHYEWMITGMAPPPGLSAWLVKLDRTVQAPATRHIALPKVITDGKTVRFRSFQFGLSWLDVSLVYRPNWTIDHPLEGEHRAARLWPPSGGNGLDVGTLPFVPEREMAWLKGPTIHLQPNVYGKMEIPALSPSTDFLSDLGPNFIQVLKW